MAESYTGGLRRSAPQWSLAGDKQLLDVLQGLHQKIIEKCQETNRNLEKMVSSLDEASLHLQNVNNKFTALSNCQFIESRVFDDDAEDITETEKPKIEPEPKPDEMASIKRSLQIIEFLHESVTILCDSDSESGTDDDEGIARVVLKPKDLYAGRPLPHIIGSRPWKTKWHAGLLLDDSDSVSSGSMKRVDNLEQYSESDEPQSDSPRHSPRRLSSSSEVESEHLPNSMSTPKPIAPPRGPRSQSDVAAELARRLGAADHKIPDPEPAAEAPSSPVRKLFKPHQPTPGTVFLDEPPPLGSDQSDGSDDDIFAQLRNKEPHARSNKAASSAPDDLFGPPVFTETPPPLMPPAKLKQTLFEDESEPELFADKPKPPPEPRTDEDVSFKKPIGGKSLFGSNATAERIGAAILKRNHRHSSTSGEESEQEPPQIINKFAEPKNKVTEENIIEKKEKENEARTQKEKERDIFDDLFAKSERINKEKNKNKVVEHEKELPKPVKKPDLFSDNIFDDIDDIFTTNIKVITKDKKEKAQKSIFDDDDLFADVSKNEYKINKTESKNTKDLFDGNNDDIFSNKPADYKRESKDIKENSKKETKSIFDDSDDDLFSDVHKTKTTKNVTMSVNVTKNETVSNLISSTETEISEDCLLSEDEVLLKKKKITVISQNIKENCPEITTENKIKIDTSSIEQKSKIIKSPNLFEDDYDDGQFLYQSQNKTGFKENTESKPKYENDKESRGRKSPDSTNKTVKAVITEVESTSSIFGDDDTSDDLFSKAVKPNKEDNVNNPGIIDNQDSVKDKDISTKCDKTLDTNVKKAEPNTTEKQTHVTVPNAQTTIKPTSESLSTQDVTTTDATVFDTKVTIIPEDTNKTVTTANITVNETEVVVRPNIAQAKPTSDFEEHFTKNDVLDNMKDVDANKNLTDSIFDDFTVARKPPIVTNTDVFSDIFNDQPPVFEKPKEPKRSKNINALFDDDSDDESLFFKKNDVITDERPEGFVSSDDRLFGLFRDEPPTIDVDFVQKSNKTDRFPKENVSQNIHSVTSSQNVENITKPDIIDGKIANKDIVNIKKKNIHNILERDDIFASSIISKPTSVKNVKFSDDSDENLNKEDLFSNVLEKKSSVPDDVDIFVDEVKTEITTQEKIVPEVINNVKEPKKVGKLKPMNFNINVNSLLPGASPKKTVKSCDKTDGQAPSKSNDELHSSDSVKDNELEPKLVKSISFGGNPGSPVLDNKLSKERAKIQVKRRPSTRRARREAVKKSGIDFGEDSTDNSSSIDDQPKNKDEGQYEETSANDKTTDQQERRDFQYDEENITTDTSLQVENSQQEQKRLELKNNVKDSYESSSNLEDVKYETKKETAVEQKTIEDKTISEIETKTNQPKDVKSKIVYILNDEDIFDAKVSKIPEIPKQNLAPKENIKTKIVFNDPDDIFKSMTKNENTKDGMKTLGQVYNEPILKTQNLDFFSDSDDDNLFKTSKTTKEAISVQKKDKAGQNDNVVVKDVYLKSKNKISLFDDTSDDLFKGKTKENVKNVSLFGSDSDEELFGGSKKIKEVPKKDEFKKEEIKREIKKGSLFDDDDDDGYLFGAGTKKKIDAKPHSSQPTATREVVSIPPEPVFDDPLSLLGSDEE